VTTTLSGQDISSRPVSPAERHTTSESDGPVRGTIRELRENGEIVVDVPSRPAASIVCDFLYSSSGPAPQLGVGDIALIVPPRNPGERGCVLGRIGPYRAPDTDTVTIEAQRELVLKCGEGAITLRSDGKVLTRGVDIASVAKRRNRIKGGSVDIN
jgi:hypothetical protein